MSTTTKNEVTEGYIRLHVTPFRPELLNSYLGPSLAPLARNISYHTIETYPEKGFGYLELPVMEATKLKKKLNGSILKGQKIRLEDAKPEKRKRGSVDQTAVDDEDGRKEKKKSKKVKAQEGVLPGYELEDGRKVKRGWTETPAEKRKEKDSKKDKKNDKSEKKEKKLREPSKYTGEPECLFRTTLPPNVESQQSEEKKSKKDKKKGKREVVVHEFSNSKKHSSFLKTSRVDMNGDIAQEYVDGKGWVDAEGNVLEEETEKQREKRERRERKEREKAEKRAPRDEESSEQDKEPEPAIAMDIAEVDELHDPLNTPAPESAAETSPTAEFQAPEQPQEIHPLEALYKRPKLPTLDISPDLTPKESAFSFFSGDNDSDIDEDMPDAKQAESELRDAVTDMIPPQTPFTKQDMEWRGTRSAAPTPDTAAIGRRFSFSFMGHIPEDDEDEEDEEDEDATRNGIDGPEASAMEGLGIANGATTTREGKDHEQEGEVRNESEFAKWFYDHRSENNKKWRARRKEAMKLKRKRENRRLTRRIV